MPQVNNPPSTWRILLPVGLGTALSLVGDSALYTVLPTHTAVAGIALASVGILLSVNRLIRMIANPVAGWTSDRVSKRLVFIFSMFLGAASTAVYGLTFGFPALFAGRLLWGIAWSGIWVAGNGLILDAAPVMARGRWVGRYHFFFFLGAAMGAAIGGLLTDRLGYHQAMIVAAVMTLAGALVALFFLPAVPAVQEKEADGLVAGVADTGSNKHEISSENENLQLQAMEGELLDGVGENENIRLQTTPATQNNNWSELLSATAVQGLNRLVVAGILTSTFALFLQAMFGDSVVIGGTIVGVTTITGILSSARIILGMAFTPAIGSLSDRARTRWQVIGGGLVPGIAGFMLLAINVPLAMLIGLPLTSVTTTSNQSLSTALIGDLGQREKHGRYLGLLYTVGDIGSAIGPLLAFALLPLWGITRLYWLNAFLFGLLLLLALYWTRRKRAVVNY